MTTRPNSDVAMGDEAAAGPNHATPPHDAREALRVRGWQSPEMEPKDSSAAEHRRVNDSQANQEYQENSDEDDQDDESMDDAAAARDNTKRSRYLREADRHAILRRIDMGEKQAELAREFGVTRAAICHINKNRVEILARSNRPDVHAAARHPKRRMSKEAIVQRQQYHQQLLERSSRVFEASSVALSSHVATLRNTETDRRVFRAAADRASWLLIEEALAAASMGHAVERPTCAMVMSEAGYPLLQAFRSIQPNSPVGFLTLAHHDDNDPNRVTLRKMSAPLDLRDQLIFLLEATCATAVEASVAVQSLLDFGANEARIFFVTLMVSEAAVDDMGAKFPATRIVTAAVERDVATDVGGFCERYFNATTIRQSGAGASVNL